MDEYSQHAEEIERLSDHQGVDVIEDFVGASYFPQHLRLLKEGGRLIQVGLMGGVQTELDLGIVLRKRLQIKGSMLRTRSLGDKRSMTAHFCKKWLPLLKKKTIMPILDRIFSIEDVIKAHEWMENNQNFGKIVLIFSKE